LRQIERISLTVWHGITGDDVGLAKRTCCCLCTRSTLFVGSRSWNKTSAGGRVSVTFTTIGQCPPTVSTFRNVKQPTADDDALWEACGSIRDRSRQLNMSTMLGSVSVRKAEDVQLYPHQPKLPSRNMLVGTSVLPTRQGASTAWGRGNYSPRPRTRSVVCRV